MSQSDDINRHPFPNLAGPEKRPHIPHKVVDEGSGRFRIEFTTVEVGSYVIDVTVNGLTVPNSPLIAKAYDAGLIKVLFYFLTLLFICNNIRTIES
jgi:hypothetical protein